MKYLQYEISYFLPKVFLRVVNKVCSKTICLKSVISGVNKTVDRREPRGLVVETSTNQLRFQFSASLKEPAEARLVCLLFCRTETDQNLQQID